MTIPRVTVLSSRPASGRVVGQGVNVVFNSWRAAVGWCHANGVKILNLEDAERRASDEPFEVKP